MTIGKTIVLARWTFVGKVMSLLFNMLSAAAKSLQSCLTLCDPIDGSPPGSPVPGILQARILEWVVISFSRRYSQPRGRTQGSCIAGRFLYHLSHQENPAYNQWLP